MQNQWPRRYYSSPIHRRVSTVLFPCCADSPLEMALEPVKRRITSVTHSYLYMTERLHLGRCSSRWRTPIPLRLVPYAAAQSGTSSSLRVQAVKMTFAAQRAMSESFSITNVPGVHTGIVVSTEKARLGAEPETWSVENKAGHLCMPRQGRLMTTSTPIRIL